tara:strand:- start:1968 stop:2249 length:282 start_codon:yes stop_codon:yes gene_type:complete
MLDSLCIIFYTAYFKWADGSYSPIPQTTNRIEIKTEKLKTLLLKTKNNTWYGIVNGKIFYGELPKYRNYICKLADKELLPEVAYKRRAVLVEN